MRSSELFAPIRWSHWDNSMSVSNSWSHGHAAWPCSRGVLDKRSHVCWQWCILGFQKAGPNFRWPPGLTQRGAKLSFPNFSYGENKIFFAKGGMAQPPPLNTPLCPGNDIKHIRCVLGMTLNSSGVVEGIPVELKKSKSKVKYKYLIPRK